RTKPRASSTRKPAASTLNGHGPLRSKPAPSSEPETAAPPVPVEPSEATQPAGPDVWDERVAAALRVLRRRITGQYEVDEFGFDRDLTEAVLHPVLRLAYRHYFRVEALGAENLPEGAALIVANHSGTVPVDALMLTMAVHDETPERRHLRLLGADLVFRLP